MRNIFLFCPISHMLINYPTVTTKGSIIMLCLVRLWKSLFLKTISYFDLLRFLRLFFQLLILLWWIIFCVGTVYVIPNSEKKTCHLTSNKNLSPDHIQKHIIWLQTKRSSDHIQKHIIRPQTKTCYLTFFSNLMK